MSTAALLPPDPALLPDDPAVLKQLVVQLLEELRSTQARLERQEHHMHLLLKRLYGSTSEKFDPRQSVLFAAGADEEDAASSPPVPPPATSTPSASSPTSKNRDRHGRGRIPENIERKEEIHDLSAAEKAALDAVGGRPRPQEIRPQGATAGERPDARRTERGGGPQAAPGRAPPRSGGPVRWPLRGSWHR